MLYHQVTLILPIKTPTIVVTTESTLFNMVGSVLKNKPNATIATITNRNLNMIYASMLSMMNFSGVVVSIVVLMRSKAVRSTPAF